MTRKKLEVMIDVTKAAYPEQCEKKISDFLRDNGISKYKVMANEMFDGQGWSMCSFAVSVAWIENGKLELFVSSIAKVV